MNILQEFDSVLYYENIEKFWKQYKFLIIGGLISIFAAVAGLNLYNKEIKSKSEHDTSIMINIMSEQYANASTQEDAIKRAITEVFTQKAKNALTIELAKRYKIEGNITKFEETLLALQNTEDSLTKEISTYMLAEYYLSVDAQKSIDFIDSVKLKQNSFKYPLILDLKAMALTSLGKTAEAKAVYLTILQVPNLPANLKTRINAKLGQLK